MSWEQNGVRSFFLARATRGRGTNSMFNRLAIDLGIGDAQGRLRRWVTMDSFILRHLCEAY